MTKGIFKSILFILPLCWIIAGCDNPADNNGEEEHTRAVGIVIYSSGSTVVQYERDEAVSGSLSAPLGELSDHYNIVFISEDGDEFVPHLDESALGYTIADTNVVVLWQHPGEEGGWEFHLRGKQPGETTIRFKVMHGDHPDFTSKAIPVVVQEE